MFIVANDAAGSHAQSFGHGLNESVLRFIALTPASRTASIEFEAESMAADTAKYG